VSFLDKLIARDRNMAASYTGETASQKAARKRREGHRRSIAKTAAAGQAWEQQDRRRFR
jgi:hypothetical protein